MSELTREGFLKDLRAAIKHLREPNFLRSSPLAGLFGVGNRADTPAALRQILIDAVRSLKPGLDEPAQSPAWRLYESLFYRYVQYSSQLEVANQLGISTRQLRREQAAALEALAYQLWEQFGLEAGPRQAPAGVAAAGAEGGAASNAVYENLAWLKDAPPQNPADLERELPTILDLIRPLATQRDVRPKVALDDGLPALATDPVALRQTLLCLLGVAIARSRPGSCVRISTRLLPGRVGIDVCSAASPANSQPISDSDAASLHMARRLAGLCGGMLILSAGDAPFSASLTLPALGQLPVLAIDDNEGTLHLLRRYTAGTRYRLVGTRDPDQALSLAQEHSPQVIVLDVMMPRTDGWEVLGQLRQHPLTGHIPIVVCTILAQEQLALSLGASSFVRKPVTRRAFLAALDRQLAPRETGSG